MDKETLISKINEFVQTGKYNYVSPEDAIYPNLAGMKIFDAPLVGFSSADDKLYTEEYKKEGVISPQYKAPTEWLLDAKSVISFFLPFSEEIRESNRTKKDESYDPSFEIRASAQWLHGRIEGQAFVNELTNYIQELLSKEAQASVCPTTSGKLQMITPYISTWSERHAAYASGLGTFGLSKGLITEKGMAGRFGSVITTQYFEPTVRPYKDPFEYCIMCGACQKRCPAGAIDKGRGCALGKDQNVCGPYVNSSNLPPHGPHAIVRYGCGKCQVAVPCEFKRP